MSYTTHHTHTHTHLRIQSASGFSASLEEPEDLQALATHLLGDSAGTQVYQTISASTRSPACHSLCCPVFHRTQPASLT
jgi:hypothetical protein